MAIAIVGLLLATVVALAWWVRRRRSSWSIPVEEDESFPLVLTSDSRGTTVLTRPNSTSPGLASVVAANAEAPHVGPVLLDHYEIERKLGTGGQGEVLLVRSHSTGARHAVKRAKVGGVEARRRFLSELGVWVDLPEHPSLARLNFFRSAGSEILLFAEYVEGGSLQDWIAYRRLTEEKDLLATAIRSAWALYVAHSLGVIHQDVKPENFLMAGDGAVKLADFGLARARAAQDEQAVDVVGFTRAYRAPEQVSGGRVDARSDLYSWAASMLKMWLGEEAAWEDGLALAVGAEQYLTEVAPPDGIPPIPAPFADVLRRCLRMAPEERIADACCLSEELKTVYHQVTGAAFVGRLTPPPDHGMPDNERPPTAGWKPGSEWLGKAQAATNAQTPLVALIVGRSWRARAVGDLLNYEDAAGLLETVDELRSELADLYIDKILVHAALDDIPGARASFERAAEFFASDESLDDVTRVESWAHACNNFMSLALRARRLDWAIDAQTRAVLTLERLRSRNRGTAQVAALLANAESTRGEVLGELGDVQAALGCHHRALSLLEECSQGDFSVLLTQTRSLQGAAKALRTLGRLKDAIASIDKLIALLERRVAVPEQRDRDDQTVLLAIVLVDKALWLRELGRLTESLRCHDRAIRLVERLAVERPDLEPLLALYCQNKAYVARLLNDVPETVELLARSIEIRERIVARTNDSEDHAELAEAYWNAGVDLLHLGLVEDSFPMVDRSISAYESLIDRFGRQEFLPKLGRAYESKATYLVDRAAAVFRRGIPAEPMEDASFVHAVEQLDNARSLHQRAVAVFERLWGEVGMPHYAVDLARAKLCLASDNNLLMQREAAHELAEEVLGLAAEPLGGDPRLRAQMSNIAASARALLKLPGGRAGE